MSCEFVMENFELTQNPLLGLTFFLFVDTTKKHNDPPVSSIEVNQLTKHFSFCM